MWAKQLLFPKCWLISLLRWKNPACPCLCKELETATSFFHALSVHCCFHSETAAERLQQWLDWFIDSLIHWFIDSLISSASQTNLFPCDLLSFLPIAITFWSENFWFFGDSVVTCDAFLGAVLWEDTLLTQTCEKMFCWTGHLRAFVMFGRVYMVPNKQ